MIKNLYYHIGTGDDPFYNLALEEYLLHAAEEGELILYLWQNRKTVVIGRNQNAWSECRTALLEEDGGHLARRLSGGGAVYHDLGNLNFTFLVRETDYDVEKQTGVILDAVRSLGVDAAISGRNDLTAEGKKFSGHAYYHNGKSAYHHGTLMVSVELETLTRYLTASKAKLQGNGVDSVRARVVNLSALSPGLDVPLLREALVESVGKVYGLKPEVFPENRLDQEALDAGKARFASWEWRYGAPVRFPEQLHARFPWGEVSLGYAVERGLLHHVSLYSDGLESDFLASFPSYLEGCRYDREAFCARLTQIPALSSAERQICADIEALFLSQFADATDRKEKYYE